MKKMLPGMKLGIILGVILGVLLGILVTKITYNTVLLAIGLLILVSVNVALGTLHSWLHGTFDETKLWNGAKKGGIVAVCFAAFYIVGQMNPDIAAINIQENTITVGNAADILMTSAYVLYAKDVFAKLYKMILGKTPGAEEDQDDSPEAEEDQTDSPAAEENQTDSSDSDDEEPSEENK